MRASFRLIRVAGIDIGVHYTWLIAFALVSWTLAQGFFPDSYPGWETATYWVAGVLAALLLFLSVLVHELAHSLVARARGLPVRGITLFIFGGVSAIGEEPQRARDEFLIALVGPLTSFLLAGAFWLVLFGIGGGRDSAAAVLAYLSFINLTLGLFNLLPGFPLDGGRVLRSLLWGALGSLARATNIAALVGQGLAFLLIVGGVFFIFSGDLLGGLWIAFIGWFLNGAADASRRETTAREGVKDVQVVQIMDREPETTVPETRVSELVSEYLFKRGLRAVPVCRDGEILGIVSLTDVKGISQERWAEVSVGEIMSRWLLYTVNPSDGVVFALRLLAERNINQVLVLADGRLVGLLSRSHIIRHLQLQEELGIRPYSF